MWLLFAILSAVFAAATSILAKVGIDGVDSNLATAIRTIVVLLMAWGMVFMTHSAGGISSITLGTIVLLHEVKDGDSLSIEDLKLTCFDIHSTKEKQFGFLATLPEGKRLCCLGDEPYNPVNEQYAKDADWLLAESFCLYDHRDIFKPYEKSHVTVKDAAEQAESLGVKNLVIYHTEDKNIVHRKELYTAEAMAHYPGNVFVPEDLETILL